MVDWAIFYCRAHLTMQVALMHNINTCGKEHSMHRCADAMYDLPIMYIMYFHKPNLDLQTYPYSINRNVDKINLNFAAPVHKL